MGRESRSCDGRLQANSVAHPGWPVAGRPRGVSAVQATRVRPAPAFRRASAGRGRAHGRRGRPVRRLSILLALALWSAGCASTQETAVLPPDEQFERAQQEFADGDIREAIAHFQTFAFNYPQDPRVPEARWMTAQGYHAIEDWATAAQEDLNYQRDYPRDEPAAARMTAQRYHDSEDGATAAQEYLNCQLDYPRDERAAEGLFQAGRAYQQMSLRPELDQRETERAVNAYDRVVVEYPRSEFVEEARTRKAQLRDKLAEKVFLNAEFYFDNENYSASEIYLTDLIAMYTDTSWIPAAYALLARTKCQQGLGDRASEVYARLRENYPDSQAAREVVGELPERCRATQAASDGDAPAPTSGR